jgi:[acyl-carrier-protein] S-malonyltransferase
VAGRYGLMFAGQGAQSVGMGRGLYEAYAVARDVFREAEEASGLPLRELCFEGPPQRLAETEITQPALLTVDIAAWRVFARETGAEAAVAAGLSLGEYAALVAADSVDFATAVRLVRERGRLMQEAVPVGVGGMLALLGLDAERVEALCQECGGPDEVAPANYNCPGQIVVSGRLESLERVRVAATAAGARRAVYLEVSAPFHMPMLAPARRGLAPLLAAVAWRRPAFPVVANLTGRVVEPDEIADSLARQVDHPVRWEECVRTMVGLGVDVLLEVGPGRALAGFARRIAPDVPVRPVAAPEDILALQP